MNLKEKVRTYDFKHLRKDLVWQFGDRDDGAIEFIGLVEGGEIEVGYYYGKEKKKSIISISQQIGCISHCKFCELGQEKYVRDLSPEEIYEQVILMLKQADQCGIDIKTPQKISFGKCGDALANKTICSALEKLAELDFSLRFVTIFPRIGLDRFRDISDFASTYSNTFQMMISLISTSETYRREMTGINLASFEEIRKSAEYWKHKNPDGRKINLNLILTENVPINVSDVSEIFPPELFRFRFRNYVPTRNGSSNSLETISQERFREVYRQFEERGYEVSESATPTPIEQRFGLASNVTLHRYKLITSDKM